MHQMLNADRIRYHSFAYAWLYLCVCLSEYGPRYGASILEAVRRITETCDSLQAFFLMHSLGGGTGSGLGTYILGQLEDAYPDIYRFVTCVFPSDQDDVVTSPYNSVLSLGQLISHADCVLPIHNQALIDICAKINKPVPGAKDTSPQSASLIDVSGASTSGGGAMSHAKRKLQKSKAFDEMNMLAAQLLTSLTCSMRFEGELNVDLNEITMNLVPFPRLHFLLASLAPLGSTHVSKYAHGSSSSSSGSSSASILDPRMPASGLSGASKSIDSMFTSLFSPSSHLVKSNPKHTGVYLACGIFARGDLSVSDLNRNIARMKKDIHMISWNEDGFKIGLCTTPPVGLRHSMLALSNSTCIADLMDTMHTRCEKLYSRRAHFHHYLEYMEQADMDHAIHLVDTVIQDYAMLERRDIETRDQQQANGDTRMPVQRMRPL